MADTLFPSDGTNQLIFSNVKTYINEKYSRSDRQIAYQLMGILDSNGEELEYESNQFYRYILYQLMPENVPLADKERSYTIHEQLENYIRQQFQALNMVNDYGFAYYDSQVYKQLLDEVVLDDFRLTPENFEQRTRLNINTYPRLIEIFSNMNYQEIYRIGPATAVYQSTNNNDINNDESVSTLGDILTKEFGFDSKYGYINKRFSTLPALSVVKNNYPILNPVGSNCYSMRYTKEQLYYAMIDLGFAPSNDLDPKLRKPTLADIRPNNQLRSDDYLIPLPGFNMHKYYKRDCIIRGHVYGRKGWPTKNDGANLLAGSLFIYYETIYRSLARTSQHLPWDDFIVKLEKYAKITEYSRMDMNVIEIEYGNIKQYNNFYTPRYPLAILPETIKFIANYDYDIPNEILDASTTLEICRLIQNRILTLQKTYQDSIIKELKEVQPHLIGGIVPKSQYLSSRQNIDEYLVHYQDILKLCEDINSNDKNDPDHRSELFRYLELFDLFGLFKNPIETYSNKQICSTVSKYLRSLFEERRQGGEFLRQHL
jgi:hypothetical protein